MSFLRRKKKLPSQGLARGYFPFFNYKMWVLISWWLKLISQMFFVLDGEILGQR